MVIFSESQKTEQVEDVGAISGAELSVSTNISIDSSLSLKQNSSTKSHNPGFSHNAFGGFTRLDTVDLRPFRPASSPPEAVLFLHTIIDAAHNYLFYGLCSNNGTNAEEFFYAYEYFFKVRSGDLKRYDECKSVSQTYCENGVYVNKEVELSLMDYDLMCFDTHIKYSGINCSADDFSAKLKSKRKAILKHNWEQVTKYFDTLNADGDQLNLRMVDRFKILSEPESPEDVESLFKCNQLSKPLL